LTVYLQITCLFPWADMQLSTVVPLRAAIAATHSWVRSIWFIIQERCLHHFTMMLITITLHFVVLCLQIRLGAKNMRLFIQPKKEDHHEIVHAWLCSFFLMRISCEITLRDGSTTVTEILSRSSRCHHQLMAPFGWYSSQPSRGSILDCSCATAMIQTLPCMSGCILWEDRDR
jgi:hypothetical protein